MELIELIKIKTQITQIPDAQRYAGNEFRTVSLTIYQLNQNNHYITFRTEIITYRLSR